MNSANSCIIVGKEINYLFLQKSLLNLYLVISLDNFRIHVSSSVLIFNKQSYVNMVSFKENSQDIHVRGLDNSRYK